MKTHLRRLNYANVMATLGVFIALGGTSYAAVKIDGSGVKNGTLTGRDLKDRSIGSRDLKQKVTGERGPAGPAGTPGVAGPPGLKGERGPAFGTLVGGPFTTTGIDKAPVVTLEIRPGHWLISATGTLANQATTSNLADCDLIAGPASDLEIVTRTGNLSLLQGGGSPNLGTETFSLLAGVFVDEPGAATLRCRSASGPVRVGNSRITAIQAGNVLDQTDESEFPV